MKDEMQYRPRLHERDGTFYFRAKVPPDLLPFYPGREVKFSLKTRDRHKAWALVQLESVRLDQEFAMHRAKQVQPAPELTVVTRVDDAFIAGVCTSFLRDSLDADIELRTGDFGETEQEVRQEYQAEHTLMLRKALSTGKTEIVDALLRAFLRSLGYELRVSDGEYRRLAYAFLQAYAKGTQQISLRDEGEIVETEFLAPAAKMLPTRSAEATGATWPEVFNKWRNATVRRPKTADEFNRIWEGLKEFANGKTPGGLTKKDIIEYRDHLQSLHTNKTVDKKISILRTLFRLAVRDDLLHQDPTEGVTVVLAKTTKKPRTNFTVDDLNAIFGSPLFGAAPPAEAVKFGAAAYWIPLIGLYTGARIEEIAQLRVSEVKASEEHGHYFEFTDEGEDSQLKNAASRRRVPLHSALIAAGFLDYLKGQNKSGAYLFPALKPDKYERRSSGFSKFFNSYLRKSVGITDKRKVFHSFRHNFKHICRELGIAEDVHDALTGHTNGSEARSYGNDAFPLGPLVRAVRSFEVVNLKAVPRYAKGQ